MFGRKKKEILANGIRARALITGIEDTGTTINDNPRVKLVLQVQPEGELPFEASKKVTVSRIAIPSVGSTMWVRFDPADRTRIELDESGSESARSTVQVNVAGLGLPGQQVTVDGQPLPVSPAGFTSTTVIDGGTTVIDARNVPGLRDELMKAVGDIGAGGDPAELREAVMKAMSQGTGLAGPPAGIAMGAPGAAPPAPAADPLDRLKKLNDLRQSGALTDAEFEAQKVKLLGET